MLAYSERPKTPASWAVFKGSTWEFVDTGSEEFELESILQNKKFYWKFEKQNREIDSIETKFIVNIVHYVDLI